MAASAAGGGSPTGASEGGSTLPSGSRPAEPTIVLVHGAWADASSWNRVIPILRARGYHVVAPPNPLRGVTHDAITVANYLATITGPVILAAHSYGGAVATNAATGNPYVKALVFIDAFVPAQGETLGELAVAQPGSCVAGPNPNDVFTFSTDPAQPADDPDLYLKIPAGPGYIGFDECFANMVDDDEAALLAAGQRPLALGAFTEPSGAPAWSTIPSWALIGTRDRVIPPVELELMAKRAGAHIEHVDAGHLSMISQPRAAADLILRAARATT